MYPKPLRMVLAPCVAALLLAPPAEASPLANGDFADPIALFGWASTGTVVGEPTGDFGQLGTDGTGLRTLEQTLTLPLAASTLAFDFAFSTDATSAPGGFPDSFAAGLITAGGDFLDILVVDLLGVLPDPSDGIESITGALPIDVALDPTVTIPGFTPFGGGTTYTGRISLLLPAAVLGQGATLYFDLIDQPDGATTIAALDNVTLVPANLVPVPATLGLVLIGLAATSVARRRQSA